MVPLLESGGFSLGAYVSAGPAWLRTDIGDATGVDSGIGLRGEYSVSAGVALVGALELDAFFSDDFFSWGPVANAGFVLRW
jgi:hypothetical protein